MKLINLIKIASRTIFRNRLRSFLTMLGIIIGVASVIAMMAIGEGSRRNIQASISSLGSNSIMIIPGTITQGGVRLEAGSSQTLKKEDARAVGASCESIKYVTPLVQKGAQVISAAQNWRTIVFGVYADYFPIRNLTIEEGALFTDNEERAAAKVCIIGQTVINNLFGENASPIGQMIRINRIPFTIIGVLGKKGQNAFGQDQDDMIIAPFSTVQKRMLATTNLNMILAAAESEEVIDEAKKEIVEVMRERHKLLPGDEDDFTVRSLSEVSSIFGSVTRVLSILLASIAGISLLVGGIGIMNIMLVSVTERTREIGIRLAVGARGIDVLVQFLIESVFMSFVGGILGVSLGTLISSVVSTFGGWPVTITPFSITLGFLFSAFIGIFFGWYPARKASRLNPIEALRYE